MHPSFGAEREYQVTVRGRVQAAALRRLEKGVELEDGMTAPARVGAPRFDPRTRTSCFSLTLTEGKKRQIRRAMQALGYHVLRLEEHVPRELRTLEEVRDEIVSTMKRDRLNDRIPRYLQELRQTTPVQVAPAYEKYWDSTSLGEIGQ